MVLSRRAFLALSVAASAGRLLAQGVASRGIKPDAKPARSGRPFNAHFVDVAREAGLVQPVIYGNPDHCEYILEAIGRGCAFIDYDNDGWMDISLLTGTRLTGAPPGTSNRLYNNHLKGDLGSPLTSVTVPIIVFPCTLPVDPARNGRGRQALAPGL